MIIIERGSIMKEASKTMYRYAHRHAPLSIWHLLCLLLCLGVAFASPLSARRIHASSVQGNWIAYKKGLDAVIVRLYQNI